MPNSRVFSPTSEAFRLATSPFYLIAHADFMYHEHMDAALAGSGATRSMYRIMTVLRDNQPCRMTDLADMALIKRPTVSRVVDRMQSLGLVETVQNSDDHRATDVFMSAAGRKLLDRLTPLIAPLFTSATANLNHQQLEQLVSSLQTIGENLRQAPPQQPR